MKQIRMNGLFGNLITADQLQRGQWLTELRVGEMLANIFLDYQRGEFDAYGYTEYAIWIEDELGMTEKVILETLRRMIEIQYEFRIVNRPFSTEKQVEIRMDNAYLDKLFERDMKERVVI